MNNECSNCGHFNSNDATKCENCGANLVEILDEESNKMQKNKNGITRSIILMVSARRLERLTDRLEGDCSIQLSYADISC